MTKKEKVQEIIDRLAAIYPNPSTSLKHANPLELLIATILSAQATDKLVNQITPGLFQKYKSAQDFSKADPKKLNNDISKINFHNNKTKNIQAACKIIAEKHNGEVPDTMQALVALPGIARKTANVVLGNAFHKTEGIVVDTHVKRLSRKLGLSTSNDPQKIEQDLMRVVPGNKWIDFSHLLINYGRDYCPARPHNCKSCPLYSLYQENS